MSQYKKNENTIISELVSFRRKAKIAIDSVPELVGAFKGLWTPSFCLDAGVSAETNAEDLGKDFVSALNIDAPDPSGNIAFYLGGKFDFPIDEGYISAVVWQPVKMIVKAAPMGVPSNPEMYKYFHVKNLNDPFDPSLGSSKNPPPFDLNNAATVLAENISKFVVDGIEKFDFMARHGVVVFPV